MNDTLQFTLRPLTVPRSIDDDDAADFIAMTNVRNDVFAEISGNRDEALTPLELLPHFQPTPENDRRAWMVLVDDAVVGRVIVDLPQEEGSVTGYALIELLAAVHGRGIGSALVPLIEDVVRDAGRSVVQSWAEHPEAPGESLASPTGYGRIPLDHAARFYVRHGFTLEQVERKSELDLRAGDAEILRLLAEAQAAATGYRIVQWTVPTPAELRADYAWVKSRMSTDAPSAGLEADEEVWDEARIDRHDQRYLDARQTVLVTGAVHEESGRLVAFNELMIGEDRTAVTQQEDTLVLREHRGHRLGQLVKCAGILRWREIAPASPKILTYNAEENRPMLDINEAIGFAPVAYVGAWKKTLV